MIVKMLLLGLTVGVLCVQNAASEVLRDDVSFVMPFSTESRVVRQSCPNDTVPVWGVRGIYSVSGFSSDAVKTEVSADYTTGQVTCRFGYSCILVVRVDSPNEACSAKFGLPGRWSISTEGPFATIYFGTASTQLSMKNPPRGADDHLTPIVDPSGPNAYDLCAVELTRWIETNGKLSGEVADYNCHAAATNAGLAKDDEPTAGTVPCCAPTAGQGTKIPARTPAETIQSAE